MKSRADGEASAKWTARIAQIVRSPEALEELPIFGPANSYGGDRVKAKEWVYKVAAGV